MKAKTLGVKTWYIHGKGLVSRGASDCFTGDSFADIKYSGYGLLFTGTKKQLDDYLLKINDYEFKCIGIFEYKSSEYYMFKYGVDYDITKDENYRPIN
tara:strand:+ start:295 stop:588 length:294 start_codon:yes stop_codon:yes gene_type:complete